MVAFSRQRFQNGVCIFLRDGVEVVALRSVIIDAESAPRIDIIDVVTIVTKLLHEARNALHRCSEWGEVGDLRADVHADTGNFQMFVLGGFTVELASASD